ncbi:MAG: hypothetical protein AAF725_26430, partial [Acidobacteriota bacterium]
KRQAALDAAENPGPAGMLDIDCNSTPETQCRRPIENIFWPPDSAPAGSYRTWVTLFRQPVGADPVPYTLEIRHGERVVQTFEGSLQEVREDSRRFGHVFSGSGAPAPRPSPE